MKVRIVPHKRASVAWNLALEEALFLKAKERLLAGKEIQPVVKLYSFSKPSVVLGYMQDISEIDKDYCDEYGVDVTMRTTGGGSVYLGEKDLQYSLLLPQDYSKALLKEINQSIVEGLQDVGFSPNIINKTGHPVIRMNQRGFIFDAQRRFKNLLLHHGTTLVDNFDYEHMPKALKATEDELSTLQNGNLWLKQVQNVRERMLIKSFEKNLPQNTSVVKKDYTNSEIKLAKKLYKEFYTNPAKYSIGKKTSGICYLTNSEYNMDLYTERDSD